jgi:membrane protein implicated in regulation of membrane protease activity
MAAQPQPTASSGRERVDPSLQRALRAEHSLARGITVGVALAVPVCTVMWVGLIALALAGSSTSLVGPLAMGAGFGILTGVFFGTWWGFVSQTHTLEDLDRR